MNKIRVLLVDDTAAVRHILADILDDDPAIEVVATAADGREGLDRLQRVEADLLVLDVEMPGMGGLEMLRELKQSHPMLPVLVFSSVTERGAMVTIEALSLGACDYVPKPSMMGSPSDARDYIRATLLKKIHTLAERYLAFRPVRPAPPAAPAITTTRALRPSDQRIDLVVIGVSMGGPNALSRLLGELPADFPVPLLIVQHMPAVFTRALAQRLSSLGGMPVTECVQPQAVFAGHAWLAAGDQHMLVRREAGQLIVEPSHEEPVNFCRPSVDTLFSSAAEAVGANLLAVVMTGMGQDGVQGARVIRQAGGEVLVQDKESSVVWGMAGGVAGEGLADAQVSLSDLAQVIDERVRRHRAEIPEIRRESGEG